MKSLRALIYLIYLFVVVFMALELCLRFGLLPTEAGRIEKEIESIGEGRRVLILGDSFSLDSDGSFSRLLAEHLSSRNCRTLNLARTGYGPADYLRMFERYGTGFRPELVIVNTFVGNDTTDTAYRAASGSGYADLAKRFLSRSYTCSLFLEIRDRMLLRNRLKRVAEVQAGQVTKPASLVNPFLIELSWSHPDSLLANLLMETPDALRAWELNQGSFLEIRRIADTVNARLLLNVLPDSVQVNESHHAFYRDLGFNLDSRVLSTSVPQDLLRRFCGANNFTCLDLLPAFRAQREREFYTSSDSHWNEQGNRLAFEIVSSELDHLW